MPCQEASTGHRPRLEEERQAEVYVLSKPPGMAWHGRDSSIRTLSALVYQSALHDYRRQLLMGTLCGQSHMGLSHNYRCETQNLHLSTFSPDANLEQPWSLYQGGGCRAFVLSLTTECQYLIYQVGLGETGCFWGYRDHPQDCVRPPCLSLLPGSISARTARNCTPDQPPDRTPLAFYRPVSRTTTDVHMPCGL